MQLNILLVDDEPSIIQALKRMLRPQPWNIFQAGDGEEALNVLKQEHIHVLVTDFKMPVRDGISLCKEARRVSPHTYRLLLSGQVDYSALRDAWHAGDVHRFVAKPWDNTLLTMDIEEGAKQQKLLGHASNFRKAIANDVAVLLTDNNWVVRLANPHVCQALGQSEEELLGRNLFAAGMSAAAVTLEAEVTRQTEAGQTWLGHFTLTKQNEQIPTWMAITPLGPHYRLCVCDLNSKPGASEEATASDDSEDEQLPQAIALHINYKEEDVADLAASALIFSRLKQLTDDHCELYHLSSANEFLLTARSKECAARLDTMTDVLEQGSNELPAATITRSGQPADSDYDTWLRTQLGIGAPVPTETSEDYRITPVFGMHGEILAVECRCPLENSNHDWDDWFAALITTWQSNFSGQLRIVLEAGHATSAAIQKFITALDRNRQMLSMECYIVLGEEQLLSETEEDILLQGELVHHGVERMIRHFGRSFLNARQIMSLPISGTTLAPEFLQKMQEPRNATQGNRLLHKLQDSGMTIYAGHIKRSELLAVAHKSRIDWLSGSVLSPEISITELRWHSPTVTFG